MALGSIGFPCIHPGGMQKPVFGINRGQGQDLGIN